MHGHEKLLLHNRTWAAEKLKVDPTYFERLSADQTPAFMWVGCSDSRVPAEDITGCEPGELFVHRNIANLVVNTDLNMLSVLQYAVEVLKVKHVIVCGHYGCGGVRNALGRKPLGLIDGWLRNIKDVYRHHRRELEAMPDENARFRGLVEFNVVEQAYNLARTAIVQSSWRNEERPAIHGWVYDMSLGELRELVQVRHGDPLDGVDRYELDTVP